MKATTHVEFAAGSTRSVTALEPEDLGFFIVLSYFFQFVINIKKIGVGTEKFHLLL
jgi:hypothetical protein